MSATALAFIIDPNNEVLVSPASYWEIAIKVNIGKYPMTVPFDQFFREGIEGNDFEILPVEIRHAFVLSTLPLHHKDPFDRMMISQAIAERIPVVSIDRAFDIYGVKRIW